MAIEFNMVITREGLDFAREASANANWHLIPKRYAISATAGELSETRDYTSMLSTWTSSAMTSLLNGTNKIQTNVVINASASGIDRQIGEIYFIFTNESHEEFLFAIAQPSTRLMFTPGVQQNYIFVWTLNNANVQDIVEINYSFAEDIDAHNNDPDAHSYLLARDGSRTATDILRYATNLTFTNNYDIVNKRYVDNQISTGTNSHNANTSAHSYLLARDGSRTATGILRYDSNKSFTNNLDIVNKYYVDTQINTVRSALENQIDSVENEVEDVSERVDDIFSVIAPNYSAGFNINSGWTATMSGYINWNCGVAGDHSTRRLYINGAEVGYHSYYKYGDSLNFQFMVRKGDLISFEQGTTAKFFPCRGGSNY